MEIKYEQAPKTINRGISMIIYANPGAGKTTLATTLPADETLIITTEAGLGPLINKGHRLLDVIQVMHNNPLMSLEEIIAEIYRKIRTEKHAFKYIVIDNLSELENQLLQDYTRRRKKPSPEMKEWGDVAYRMKEWVTLFRDLEFQGVNVIFNAWETQIDMKTMTGETMTMSVPFVTKRTAVQICGLVDAVGHLAVYEKSGQRWLQFGPSNTYLTKCQFKGLGNEEADLMKVFSKINSYNYEEVQSA